MPKSVYFVDFHQVRAFSRAETWTCRGVRALDGRSGLITSRNDPQRSPGRNTGGLRALALFLRALVLIDFFEFSIFENIFRFFMFFLENRFLVDKIFFGKKYISQTIYFFFCKKNENFEKNQKKHIFSRKKIILLRFDCRFNLPN